MPLGFQRLNERVKRPNELINFIKPLPSTDESIARDYLERIAAIVYPVMKANHIAVMALEEFPSNREFWGRNFNAGEVIQLVLKSPSGAWLPFRHVQMVMIHELAHCKEMNHSRFFWRTRNSYADELRGLWQKGYTGEGFWGKGRGIRGGAHLDSTMPVESNMPDTLCGGVYRNKGKRRQKTTKPDLSWAERKQKRILKKFGAGGTALGADEVERQKLENGKKVKGKPRVAASARARELRAAAALARFHSTKTEIIKEEVTRSDESSETEDDSCYTDDGQAPSIKANGKDMVKICDGEDADDNNVKQEQHELDALWHIPERPKSKTPEATSPQSLVSACVDTVGMPLSAQTTATRKSAATSKALETSYETVSTPQGTSTEVTCQACSCMNEKDAIICIACSNVLDTSITWNHWRCTSDTCKDSEYMNLGDYGRCQICGAKRSEDNTTNRSEEDEL